VRDWVAYLSLQFGGQIGNGHAFVGDGKTLA
jgi:hypothetical protein